MGYFKKMKFDKQTIEFYNENAQKYSSYSYEHQKGDLYKKFLNNSSTVRVLEFLKNFKLDFIFFSQKIEYYKTK